MSDISMVPVTSSNIRSMGWSAGDPPIVPPVMRVEFLNGSVYDYADVSEEVFNAVLNAESVGKAYNSIVKNGGYASTKVA